MNLFEALLIGHLVGDFLLQTGWMAREKTKSYPALVAHAAVYTATVTAASLLVGRISWAGIALLFVTHTILDRRTFVHWWGRRVQSITRPADQWLYLVTDQVFHMLVLVAVVFLAGV